MLSTSANFTNKFMSSDRTLDSYVVINGTTYTSNSIVNWEFHDTISVSDTFELGTTVANTFDLTLQNVSGSFDNATVTPYVGIDVTGSGTYEYVPLGVFTVDNVETMNISSSSKNITLHCFDSMLKLDVPFTWSGGNTDTLFNIANRISTITGVSLGSDTTTNNFVGKIKPSFVENPHVSKYIKTSTTLVPPSSFVNEINQTEYGKIAVLNGDLTNITTVTNLAIMQNMFSFDVIQILERKYGIGIWEGKTTLSEKINIAKSKITNIVCNWHGYGSSPSGFKAYATIWNGSSAWGTSVNHANSTTSKLSPTVDSSNIDSNGLIHVMSYADPSNGTISGAINTDYVELLVTVKKFDLTTINKVDDIYSCREILGFISSLMGGVGVIDRYGGIKVKQFTNPSTTVLTITGDQYSDNFNKGTDTYSIARVTGYDENGDSFSNGTLSLTNMEIKFFNPFINQTLIDSIGAKLNGLTYIPFNMDWIGNPAIESGDNISIDEYGVSVFNTVLLNSTMTYPAFAMVSETKTEGKSTNSSNDFEVIPKQVQNYVDMGLFTKEDAIHKGTTPQSNPVIDSIWIDTTTIPNVIKRWDGSQWVKVTPVVPEDIGATTKAYVDQQISTVSSGGGTNIAIGSTAPATPPTDKLWIDTSVTPPVMKKWNGSSWEILDRSSFSELTGTISASQISAGTITGGMIVAGTIGAGQIAVGSLTGDRLTANTITGDKIASRTIDAVSLKAGSITANEIATNTITTNLISTTGLDASVIKAGTMSADRISGGTITGISITGSTFETLSNGGLTVQLLQDVVAFRQSGSTKASIGIAGTTLSFGLVAGMTSFNFNGNINANTINGTNVQIQGSNVATQSWVTGTALSGYATQSYVTSQGYYSSGSSPSFGSVTLNGNLNIGNGWNIGGNFQFSGSPTFSGTFTAQGLATFNANINSSGYGGTGTYTYVGSGNEVRITNTLFGGGGPTYVPCRASSFPTGSSIVYKDNLVKIEESGIDSLSLINSAQVWKYHLKSNLEMGVFDKPKVGVISEMADPLYRDENGVDPYTMVSISWKAIQQMTERIEQLETKLNDLISVQ